MNQTSRQGYGGCWWKIEFRAPFFYCKLEGQYKKYNPITPDEGSSPLL